MGLAWDEIMSKSPTMKKLIEDKITEEIEPIRQENESLKARVGELETILNQGSTTPAEG